MLSESPTASSPAHSHNAGIPTAPLQSHAQQTPPSPHYRTIIAGPHPQQQLQSHAQQTPPSPHYRTIAGLHPQQQLQSHAQRTPPSPHYRTIAGPHPQQQRHSDTPIHPRRPSQSQPSAKSACRSQAIQTNADLLLEMFLHEKAMSRQNYHENIHVLRTRFINFKIQAQAEIHASEEKRNEEMEILRRENDELRAALDMAGLTVINGVVRKKDGTEL